MSHKKFAKGIRKQATRAERKLEHIKHKQPKTYRRKERKLKKAYRILKGI
jgi:hypothetical protein